MADFERFKIKQYKLWDLFIDKNQFPYLGRCYASAKRPDADVVTDMTSEEALELFGKIIPAWDRAVKELFNHDRPNLAILGNEWRHLHAHLIPRYQTPRIFQGVEFQDPNPQGNYAPYPKRKLDDSVVFSIRDLLQKKLS
jgi:diadenosine tetraphosphate (Ap4A) HIT family hydrolase